MIPRPLGCDGDHCDYDITGWTHVDCELAPRPVPQDGGPA